ncbi:ABC-2 type transport system ATP-binding protein [Caldalkalibacillus uzonensis]|uniref:ABC-2 type transport system ATP-binding protein n=1 Tax=Caldalkalibacillus uzonensis TaxID=353224 RepID=A0ABU0CR06_9BACI|nr:ABC transporter ATP-binding protein [Caldalkalibacillus uzonensis]MDQ0338840.1 ABC-2 type transport system ATP-binding protein [Caldalkalibacillus uzonensis]
MIELNQITKQFGTFRAVNRVSLTVSEGSVFGLLGANGAGKTTLIRIMCGILPPTSGRGRVLGYDIVKERAQIKERIGYMSQKFSLYPDLTVEENIRFYAGLYGVEQIKKRTEELTGQFSLRDVSKKPVAALGGGIRQRVAFAAAIVHRPRLLFLDEPTSGVDPLTRRLFWEQLYELTEQGMTIVVTTHYMDEAERCDQVALMNQGKIVAQGKVDELKERYAAELDTERPALADIFVHVISQGGGEHVQEKLG